ncbi:rRNA methyltransferase 1, mitochondrial isoform X2 [Nematostella vectensis]|uniref:rRNA methyltransferase 1, mitochondrial isoform X2 n=1 Tax=Nematostella vectensis TaxID=45351 RepID=UPI0020778E8A|nr:rRNA methyltransferase 1, mitochondrial isoform X2 [Nematostella vectensis]
MACKSTVWSLVFGCSSRNQSFINGKCGWIDIHQLRYILTRHHSGSTRYETKSTRKSGTSSRREFIFGVGPCVLALSSGRRKVFKIYMNEEANNTARPEFERVLSLAEKKEIEVVLTSRKKLTRLSQGRPAQNIVMEVSCLHFCHFNEEDDELQSIASLHPLVLALDEIQDPMNFGAIIRTSWLLGVDKIVVPKQNSAPLSPVVSKASAGAMEVFNVYQTPDLPKFLQERAAIGWDVLGAVQPITDDSHHRPVNCAEYSLSKPTVLVLGNEGRGLRNTVQQQCTQLLSIYPHHAQNSFQSIDLDSFNVSVAAGILVFSLLKNSYSTQEKKSIV